MSAIETLQNIVNNEHLSAHQFRYCLVDKFKIPYAISGYRAKPNEPKDFCTLKELQSCRNLGSYVGIGISIKASNICAIDVDHCFTSEFDINSADTRAKDILSIFKDKAYIEFSFSGKGMRILFNTSEIENYSLNYYIKNDTTNCEYYQPSNGARYVTLTGRTIQNHSLNHSDDIRDTLYIFLNKYLKKKIIYTTTIKNENIENKSLDELKRIVKNHYLKNYHFQELWFGKAPGSGHDESQRDFHLLQYLYENVTQNKENLKLLFENSPYFTTKDKKHLYKWNYGNYRYFEYMWNNL